MVSSPLNKKALLQALWVVGYCGLVGLVFWKGESIFGQTTRYFGPVAFLVLFIVSALTCVAIVFYQPYLLFVAKKQKEAVDLVLLTTGWLFAFLVVLLLAVMIF